MRVLLIAACLAAVTGPAFACAGPPMPPQSARQEPAVPFKTYFVPRADIKKYCGRDWEFACSYPTADGSWAIIINSALDHDEVVCSLTYEKAHMPPNFWYDPAHETPETVAFIDRIKADYFKSHTSTATPGKSR